MPCRHSQVGLILLGVAWFVCSRPAWGIPLTVTRVEYETTRRRIILEVTGDAEIRTRQVDRRLIIEILDARLRSPRASVRAPATPGVPGDPRILDRESGIAVPSVDLPLIRSLLVSEVAGNPPLVRIELVFGPWAVPMLSVQQVPGRVYILLVDLPKSEGERDLEIIPEPITGSPPPLDDRRIRTSPPLPIFSPAGTFSQVSAPSPPPEIPAARPTATAATTGRSPALVTAGTTAKQRGTLSYALVNLQQAEAAETVGDKPIVGFATGPASFDLQQWIGSFFGLGLEMRYFNWLGRGLGTTVNRQDALIQLRVGARWPLPFVEPEAHFGGAVRFQALAARSQWNPPAPYLGAGLRVVPLSGLGFRGWGQYFPLGIGGDQLFRLGAGLFLEAGPTLVSVGYVLDDHVIGGGGRMTFGAVAVGAGMQW